MPEWSKVLKEIDESLAAAAREANATKRKDLRRVVGAIEITKAEFDALLRLNKIPHREGWLAWFRADFYHNVAPAKTYGYGGRIAKDQDECRGKNAMLDKLVTELLKERPRGGRLYIADESVWTAEDRPESENGPTWKRKLVDLRIIQTV